VPEAATEAAPVAAAVEAAAPVEPVAEEAPKRRRRRTAAEQPSAVIAEPEVSVEAPAPVAVEIAETPAATAEGAEGDGAETGSNDEPRRGWWQRTFGA